MSKLSSIASSLKGQADKPPVHLWDPPCNGDIDIVIKANGDWIHQGGKIERDSLVKLFASILRREQDNEYYLVTPVEKWRIKVEDAPLLVVDVDVNMNSSGDQQQQSIILTTNVDTYYALDASHPLKINNDDQNDQPKPYLQIENGLLAKFTRAAFYRLVDLAVEQDKTLRVFSGGVWFELGAIA